MSDAPTTDNTISALRNHLFEALRGLSDKSKPMDIERAKAISEIAQTIINSAKVEVDLVKVAGGKGTGFIPLNGVTGKPALPSPTDDAGQIGESGAQVVEKRPGLTVTQHRLRG